MQKAIRLSWWVVRGAGGKGTHSSGNKNNAFVQIVGSRGPRTEERRTKQELKRFGQTKWTEATAVDGCPRKKAANDNKWRANICRKVATGRDDSRRDARGKCEPKPEKQPCKKWMSMPAMIVNSFGAGGDHPQTTVVCS